MFTPEGQRFPQGDTSDLVLVDVDGDLALDIVNPVGFGPIPTRYPLSVFRSTAAWSECSTLLFVDNPPPPSCSLVLPPSPAADLVDIRVDSATPSGSPTVEVTLEHSTDGA